MHVHVVVIGMYFPVHSFHFISFAFAGGLSFEIRSLYSLLLLIFLTRQFNFEKKEREK